MAPTGPKGAPIRPSINQALLPGSGPNLAIKIWEFTDEQVGTVVSTAALQSSCPGFESPMAHNVQGDPVGRNCTYRSRTGTKRLTGEEQ